MACLALVPSVRGVVTLLISYGVAPLIATPRHGQCHHCDPLGSITLPFHQKRCARAASLPRHCKVVCPIGGHRILIEGRLGLGRVVDD